MLGAEHLARLLLLMVDERDQVLNIRHRSPGREASTQNSFDRPYICGEVDCGGHCRVSV